MADHFPEAAVRHYADGWLLHQNHRYDNAMCHYAFSAECSIKAFRTQFYQFYHTRTPSSSLIKPVLKSHTVDSALASMTEYHELLGILDPQMSLLIGISAPPSVLFQEHPDRRYRNDIGYTDAELTECRAFTARLAQQVVAAALDGKLPYESKRGVL